MKEVKGRVQAPEELQQGFAVGHHLVLLEEGVAIDGGGVALDAEVAPQLNIEADLSTQYSDQEIAWKQQNW